MEHCLIDGKRCSKCCEVLTIRESKNFREWRTYVRRNGYSHLKEEKYQRTLDNKIYHMLRKISKRRAKKINHHLVGVVGNRQSYFTCKNHTSSGCGDYENRPGMCSQYPYYGKTESEFLESRKEDKGLYTDDCTFYIELK